MTETISQFLGHPLVRRTDVEWKLYTTEAIGFYISVFEADDFENNAGIEFEKYPLMVGITGFSLMTRVEHFDEWFRSFSLGLAGIIYRDLGCECLVVKNFFDIVGAFPASEADQQSNAGSKPVG